VGDVVALVAAVAAGISARLGAGLAGLEAQSRASLDRREGRFSDTAAEDGRDRTGNCRLDDRAARGPATDQLGQVVKPAIVHNDSLMQHTAGRARPTNDEDAGLSWFLPGLLA
jgi:hypothetical protein